MCKRKGLLGLIPIYLGIKVAIYDDCEGEKRAKKELNEKGLSKLVGTVAIAVSYTHLTLPTTPYV
ncbi:hypothetical protein JMUB7552_27350 [Staphylococcus aureus]